MFWRLCHSPLLMYLWPAALGLQGPLNWYWPLATAWSGWPNNIDSTRLKLILSKWTDGSLGLLATRFLVYVVHKWLCFQFPFPSSYWCFQCAQHSPRYGGTWLLIRQISFFFFSSTSLLLPTDLPPPSCTHAQSCNPMDFSPPECSVHGFFQARILEWVAISFSR